MDDREAGQYWNDNAIAWTTLSRAGSDVYRDHLNTPNFLAMLPNVDGLMGLDIGCGEGHNTREVAKLGARMFAVDISETFIDQALSHEANGELDIKYQTASAVELPFKDNQFDFAIATMSFMDIPDPELAIEQTYRVLKPSGFLQFSISHPCFDTPHRKNLRNADHLTYAIEVGDYFKNQDGDIAQWTFGATPDELKGQFPPFKVPRFTRTLSQWVNILINAGFVIEELGEPRPSEASIELHPSLQDASVVAYFIHFRVRK